jgi:hypothetical protein
MGTGQRQRRVLWELDRDKGVYYGMISLNLAALPQLQTMRLMLFMNMINWGVISSFVGLKELELRWCDGVNYPLRPLSTRAR